MRLLRSAIFSLVLLALSRGVLLADPSLSNLSARANVGTGADVSIAGFVIGDAPKRVLIRGIGPGLTRFGVSPLLADPVLTLFDEKQQVIASNDNWNAADAAVFLLVSAFSIDAGSTDAALVITLPPGAYTAQVSGKNDGTGIAIVEVYDVDGTGNGSHLLNLSARARVGTDASVVIPGIVLANGTGMHRLLIRAAGPSLEKFGVNDFLVDPTISVVDADKNTIVANDNWGTNDQASLAAATAQAAAFSFIAPDSKDSALLATLDPGSYTIVVSGVGDTTGVALVEVYDVTPTGSAALSLAATDSAADESGNNPAVFTVTRVGGDVAQALIVGYTVSGTAINGVDFVFLTGTVTIPAGATSATITLAPTPDIDNEPVENVSLTLQPGPGYAIESGSATASVTSVAPSLYVASLRPEGDAAASTAYGTATILLSASGTLASINVSVSNLSSSQTTAYIRLGPPGQTGDYIRGLPIGQVTGALWTIEPTGNYTSADLLNALQTGLLYVGIETTNFPGGELRGTFIQSSGSQTFVVPPDPPAAPSAPATPSDAARFLTQATLGPTTASINELLAKSYSQWITDEMAKPASLHRTATMDDFAANNAGGQNPVNGVNTLPGGAHRQAAWWKIGVTGDDQLRQRVAFALSEIFVISDVDGTVNNHQEGAANYYDILVNDAFGNFRTLLEDVTLSPMMGIYLSHLRNAKANAVTGALPDENYAREVMQLFSIGLVQLQPDGTLKLDANGLPVPTYDQTTITETAKVFTGWAFYNTNTSDSNFRRGAADYIRPMSLYPTQHEPGAKTIVNGVVLPANQGGVEDLKDTLDTLFNHPNTAPFFARHMIQHLVTSNPSPAYVYRVAKVFENNGAGVRGDIGAVVRAILLDYEARSPDVVNNAGFGKLKEPLLRLAGLLRAFHATGPGGRYNIANPQNSLSQAALRSPTVFNFFEPDYVEPGILAGAGLFAPEFQIVTDSTAITVPNFFYSYIFSTPSNVALDFSEQTPLVATPDALVDQLSLLLASGALSPTAHDRIVAALGALPASISTTDRIRTAIWLTINAPDAAAQR